MKSNITKVTTHINPNEALIFERSQRGRIGYRLPPLDVDEQPIGDIVPQQFLRDDDLEGVPEVSEVDVIRHFVRMSTWNFSIDQGMKFQVDMRTKWRITSTSLTSGTPSRSSSRRNCCGTMSPIGCSSTSSGGKR